MIASMMKQPKYTKLSEYNPSEELKKMLEKNESMDRTFAAIDRLNNYCRENNCSYDDLIEAHKQENK